VQGVRRPEEVVLVSFPIAFHHNIAGIVVPQCKIDPGRDSYRTIQFPVHLFREEILSASLTHCQRGSPLDEASNKPAGWLGVSCTGPKPRCLLVACTETATDG
jgi:hypothetical protein